MSRPWQSQTTVEVLPMSSDRNSTRYNRETYGGSGLERVGVRLFAFAARLVKLRLDDAEFALLCAIAVFAGDREGLVERMAVEDIQEVYTAALQAYVDARRRGTARPVLAEILLALSELRKIAAELTLDNSGVKTETDDDVICQLEAACPQPVVNLNQPVTVQISPCPPSNFTHVTIKHEPFAPLPHLTDVKFERKFYDTAGYPLNYQPLLQPHNAL